MNNESLPVESELSVRILKDYIAKNPHEAPRLAIEHFEDYLFVVSKCKELLKKLEPQKSVFLPPIPSPGYQRLQTEYDDLLQEYKKLLIAYASLEKKTKI